MYIILLDQQVVMKNNILIFNKIKFYDDSFDNILLKLKKKGGYLVAPSALALVDITRNKPYHNSLIKSDVAILDSGLFCILLRIFKRKTVKKFSGYRFLNFFFMKHSVKKNKILSIDPSFVDARLNKKLFKSKKFLNLKNYIAPKYLEKSKNITDNKLIRLIKIYKPKYIIINLGGGVQERLALYIKQRVSKVVVIICTGAAIAFFTKRQAPINFIVDYFYLGWLWRFLYKPSIFFARNIKCLKLIKQFI